MKSISMLWSFIVLAGFGLPLFLQGCDSGVKLHCAVESDEEFCSRQDAECGTLSGTDNCGDPREVDCGGCQEPDSCGGGGESNVCGCAPEDDAAFCERNGAECDTFIGPDNCGGERTVDCGSCSLPDTCGGGGVTNQCGCTPESDEQFCESHNVECGPFEGIDECGLERRAECGDCPPRWFCGGDGIPNQCGGCVPESEQALCALNGAECGSLNAEDGCGNSRTVFCGNCEHPEVCGASGNPNLCGCVLESNEELCGAASAECGTISAVDGCGNPRTVFCGDCPIPMTCGGAGVENRCGCLQETDQELCIQAGADCGVINRYDGCDVLRNAFCGDCTSPETCSGGGVANQCGEECIAESVSEFCSRNFAECDNKTALDNCGDTRTVYCGDCTEPETCGGGGLPNICGENCSSESDSTFCERHNAECGSLTATDNCGQSRTGWCGSCTAPETCGGSGTANLCGIDCIPESDAELCDISGAGCGSVPVTDSCGDLRTVFCGGCTAPLTCGGGGTPNQCGSGCVPESDAAFCNRLGIDCNLYTAPDNCSQMRTVDCGSCASPLVCHTIGAVNRCDMYADDYVFVGEFNENFLQIRIDPADPSVIYASSYDQWIYKSNDYGVTWHAQCFVDHAMYNDYGLIKISPAGDRTAYVSAHSQHFRVDRGDGDNCREIASAWASYFKANNLAIDPLGNLYVWSYSPTAGLQRSTDRGDTWLLLNNDASLYNTMAVDPHNPSRIVAVLGSSSGDYYGIYYSTDAGDSWTEAASEYAQYQHGVRFNQAAPGWVYAGAGWYSMNGGETWSDAADYDPHEVDPNGIGYRLEHNGNQVELFKAPDMTFPQWSSLYTFSPAPPSTGKSMVSAVGSVIGVVIEGRLFVSLDGGLTFEERHLQKINQPQYVDSVAGEGDTIYVNVKNRVYQSTDGGLSWTEKAELNSGFSFNYPKLRIHPGDADRVYMRSEDWNSTYYEKFAATHDGFDTFHETDACCYSWAGVLAVGPGEPDRVFYLGSNATMSNDGGLTFSDIPSNDWFVWYPWHNAFVSPGDPEVVFYGDNNKKLWQYHRPTNTVVDLTSRLPFADPAGIEVYRDDAAVDHIRVISLKGKLAESSNNAIWFTLVNGVSPLIEHNRRILVSYSLNRDLMATAQLMGGKVAVSVDGAQSWYETDVPGCTIRDLAITSDRVLIACQGSLARAILF